MREQLVDTISHIYEAALEPTQWRNALASVVRFVGAERGSLGLTDLANGTSTLSHLYGIDPSIMEKWASEYASEDPWCPYLSGLSEGDVGRGSDLIRYEELESRPVYRDIIAPAGVYDVCWAVVGSNQHSVSRLCVYQGRQKGAFSRATVDAMAGLTPHLVRATNLQNRFSELKDHVQAFEGVLDELSFAVLTCDTSAEIISANKKAETLLATDGRLTVSRGRLAAGGAAETARLQDLVAVASSTAVETRADGEGVMALNAPEGEGRPLTVTVFPISTPMDSSGQRLEAGENASVLVMITDPEQFVHVPEGALSELYGLTPAESELALAIARGVSIAEFAARSGISVGTARWSMKNIQAKTNTRRQAELVSLIGHSLGPLIGH